jgi:ABC-type Fe3+/spermidine/putrescine transport system ATPase subunit
MKEGKIMQIGTPSEINASPPSPFEAGYIGSEQLH